MATMVYCDDKCECGKYFKVLNSKYLSFWVNSFDNGIATLDASCGTDIREFAAVVEGFFEKHSNFEIELKRVFECDANTKLERVEFSFNGVEFNITKDNADKDKIYKQYCDGLHEQAEKYRREMEEYMKTPEYREERAKELKSLNRKQRVRQKIIELDRTTQLEFKDERAKAIWKRWCKRNFRHRYTRCIVKFASCWGKHMQSIMNNPEKSLELIAHESSYASNINGITVYMYGCAVAILAECWKYGEQLRKYHNTQYGCPDAEGVINPAVICIGTE